MSAIRRLTCGLYDGAGEFAYRVGMPGKSGVGGVATAMNFASTEGIYETIITIVAFGLLCTLTYILFVFGERFVKAVGPSALNVITRMMGLILAVIQW